MGDIVKSNKHTRNVFVTRAGCVAAGVGRALSRVCCLFVGALKENGSS